MLVAIRTNLKYTPQITIQFTKAATATRSYEALVDAPPAEIMAHTWSQAKTVEAPLDSDMNPKHIHKLMKITATYGTPHLDTRLKIFGALPSIARP